MNRKHCLRRRKPVRDGPRLIPGTLDMLVLKASSGGARHGASIAQWILERSGFDLQVNDGSLYPALRRLQRRRLLLCRWGRSELNRRARYYRISAAGRRALKLQIAEWTAFAGALTSSLARAQRRGCSAPKICARPKRSISALACSTSSPALLRG